VVSESCKVQGQCLILVGCRQEVLVLEIALDRDGTSLAFEGRIDDGRGVERTATDRDMAACEEDAEAPAQDCGCALFRAFGATGQHADQVQLHLPQRLVELECRVCDGLFGLGLDPSRLCRRGQVRPRWHARDCGTSSWPSCSC